MYNYWRNHITHIHLEEKILSPFLPKKKSTHPIHPLILSFLLSFPSLMWNGKKFMWNEKKVVSRVALCENILHLLLPMRCCRCRSLQTLTTCAMMMCENFTRKKCLPLLVEKVFHSILFFSLLPYILCVVVCYGFLYTPHICNSDSNVELFFSVTM